MRREQLIEKILDIKRNKGWSWKHITEEIGGVSPILVVGALLGQMKGALLANLRQHGDDARRPIGRIESSPSPVWWLSPSIGRRLRANPAFSFSNRAAR
jgi:hypothetical protein